MKEDIVIRWIVKADNDIKAVKYLIVMEDAPLDVLSFHCQQAVEKYLKAYLTCVSISNLMVNWKNTIIPYCELQHQ